jgi:hypothetical protein
MNVLQIIIHHESQLRSRTIKTKIKRFLLRKRKLNNVTLHCEFQNRVRVTFCERKFKEFKQLAWVELKQGKNVPVKY